MEEKSDNQKADKGDLSAQPASDNSAKPSSGLVDEDELKREISKELESSKESFGRSSSISDILEKELNGISSNFPPSSSVSAKTENSQQKQINQVRQNNLTTEEPIKKTSSDLNADSVLAPKQQVSSKIDGKVEDKKEEKPKQPEQVVPKVVPPPPVPPVPPIPPIPSVLRVPPVSSGRPISIPTPTQTKASVQNSSSTKTSIPTQAPNLASVSTPIFTPPASSQPQEAKLGTAGLDEERGAFVPPPTPKVSSTVLEESGFKGRTQDRGQVGRDFVRETKITRERETVPEKKEKEFISREPEDSKDIIRTFQKDLLRRQNQVKREETIPEKEVIGFSPPIPPEEAKSARPPKFSIPSIPIPKISLKFALIIAALVIFLSGFYLIFQLKPCIPPFCKKQESPPVSVCDREELRSICSSNSGQSFPDCDTTGLCQEMSIASCSMEGICQALGGPISSCEPVELFSPVSLIPIISEEKIVISKKTKEDILSGLATVEQSISQRPYLVRVLIEYDEDECNKSWLSMQDIFTIFGINAPSDFFTNIKSDNYTLALYLPDSEEKNTCIASNISGSLCYGPRLVIAFGIQNFDNTKAMMANWEKTFFEDLSQFIIGEPVNSASEFGGSLYKEKVEFRYKNFSTSTTALNYGLYKNVLVIGTSKNSLYRAWDFILRKEAQIEEENKQLEGIIQ